MARQLFDVKSLLLTVFKLLTTVVFLLVDWELKMNKTYDVYMCRESSGIDSPLLKIYEDILRRETIFLSGKGNCSIKVDENSITVKRPKPYAKLDHSFPFDVKGGIE
jgi:hypothetical protein